MLLLAFLLLLSGLVLWLFTRRQQKAAGMPTGRVIYSDTRQWESTGRVLYDAAAGLAGRPDYLVQSGRQTIPVEVKSAMAGQAAYESHIYQLAAYCRLVESNYQTRPAYGILHYSNRTFAIDYTEQLESELLAIIEKIRSQKRGQAADRSHDSAGRCRACGFRSVCDQKIN